MFGNRLVQLVTLATYHRVPAIYFQREAAEAGGLMSYGPNLQGSYHQIGLYAGRILKGAKPADLPVQLPKAFDLVINLGTAKTLGLTVPRLLHAQAEMIE